jgi:non-specific serine/threonine protein kinase
VWAVELAATPEADAARGAAVRGDAGPRLDARARKEYAERLGELEAELDDARACSDARRLEAVRTEMDALGRELAAAVGLGGRERRSGAATERARQSVTKALRATLKKLAAEHEPLGEHLLACVRTGTACTYRPDRRQPIAWTVRP